VPNFTAIVQHNPVVGFIYLALWFYGIIILIRIILSWVNPDPNNRLAHFIYEITDPYLGLFRKLPLQFGMFDLSPIVAILVLQALTGLVRRLL
jgi:YggT family protein